MHYHWLSLVGLEGMLEGFDKENMSFKFEGIVWNVIKDDLDEERSMLDYVVYGDQKKVFKNNLSIKTELEFIEESKIKNYDVFSGWLLKEKNSNKKLLLIGTDYSNDIYPKVIFDCYY